MGAYVYSLRARLSDTNHKLVEALARIENLAVRDELTGHGAGDAVLKHFASAAGRVFASTSLAWFSETVGLLLAVRPAASPLNAFCAFSGKQSMHERTICGPTLASTPKSSAPFGLLPKHYARTIA